MYDVAIIGLGPAGATLARMLPSGFKVAVIDQKKLDGSQGGFEKSCGGLLAPDAQKIFGSFDIQLPNNILADPQIFSVRTIDLHRHLERFYHRFYLNFNRHKFDLWMASLVPPHVDIIDDARCSEIVKGDHFTISYRKGGETQTIQSTYLVGADGAKSMVRKQFDPVPIRQYVSIQKVYTSAKKETYYTCFFDETVTDCYGWVNVKDGTTELGVALPPEDCRENFEKIKGKLEAKGYEFSTLLETQSCLVSRPKRMKELTFGKDHAFLVGEAAGLVSTSSLEGISYAMESGKILAKVLGAGGDHLQRKYRKAMFKTRLRLFSKMLKSIVLYVPVFRKIVMKSGLQSFDIEE